MRSSAPAGSGSLCDRWVTYPVKPLVTASCRMQCIGGRPTHVERLVKRVRGCLLNGSLDAPNQRFGAMTGAEQATGSRGQGGAPGAKRGRTTLTPGWRLLRGSPCIGWWRRPSEDSTVRRDEANGLAARLMYAGQNRRRALRRELPQTQSVRQMPGHSRDGDRSCCGGAPAHGEVLAHAEPRREASWWVIRPPSSRPRRSLRAPGRWR